MRRLSCAVYRCHDRDYKETDFAFSWVGRPGIDHAVVMEILNMSKSVLFVVAVVTSNTSDTSSYVATLSESMIFVDFDPFARWPSLVCRL